MPVLKNKTEVPTAAVNSRIVVVVVVVAVVVGDDGDDDVVVSDHSQQSANASTLRHEKKQLTCNNRPTVLGVPGDTVHNVVNFEQLQAPSRGHLPDAHGVIVRARGQELAAW